MPSGLFKHLNVNIQIETIRIRNDRGEPIYNDDPDPRTVPCRIVEKKQWVKNPNGGQVWSQTMIIVDGDVSVLAMDRITMPDTSTAIVIAVVNRYSPDGVIWAKEIQT